MFWIFLTILLGIVGLIALFAGLGMDAAKGERPFVAYGVSLGTAFVWVALSLFGFVLHTVGQRQVGIVYSFSNTVEGKKDPGVVYIWPWQHLKTEHVGLQKIDFEFGPSNSAVSQDQQDIYAHLVVNLSVEPQDVLHLYKTVGPNWKQIVLEPRVPQDFKAVTSQYLTTDITANREKIREQTHAGLKREMRRFGIDIVDVFLANLDYSASYKQAIEEKQAQVQKSLAAKAKVDQSRYEADQKVKQAEGEAKAISLKGAALARYPEILRLEAIDKLNPDTDVVICTGRTCPSFLPSGLVGK